jgi:hypothetical protein
MRLRFARQKETYPWEPDPAHACHQPCGANTTVRFVFHLQPDLIRDGIDIDPPTIRTATAGVRGPAVGGPPSRRFALWRLRAGSSSGCRASSDRAVPSDRPLHRLRLCRRAAPPRRKLQRHVDVCRRAGSPTDHRRRRTHERAPGQKSRQRPDQAPCIAKPVLLTQHQTTSSPNSQALRTPVDQPAMDQVVECKAARSSWTMLSKPATRRRRRRSSRPATGPRLRGATEAVSRLVACWE